MSGALSLGKGRLSGACLIGDECVILIRRGGSLVRKRLYPNRRIVDEGTISYAGDGYEFPTGRVTISEEVKFETEYR